MPDLALARARAHGLAIALGMAMAGSALGNPQGPSVVHGTATFSNPSAGVLNITNSPQAIINWQAFGIDPGQITRFIQQNAGSAVLNRVVGADPSAILGSLYSNGRVFLVNPNGIVFGPSAVVDTAGLIASSLNMSNEDFLAGRMNFEGGPDSGSVINKGYIKAGRNGDVVLIAPQVENHGIIESDGGNLMLAAGEKVLITSIDNPEVTFEVQAPEHRALNMGQMIANGGAASVFAGSITQAGQISANALEVGEGGRIMLVAKADVTLEAGSTTVADGGTGGAISVESREGTAWVRGEVSAQGSDGSGGDIRLLGDRVGVFDDAVVDASSEAGGGQVLVGGDFQGANPDVKNADHTAVGENATLRADAGETGDGGKVIVWADGFTEMHGTISARGSDRAGDGGFVEISGKENLLLTGIADVRAPGGEAGTVLLDPRDIRIGDPPPPATTLCPDPLCAPSNNLFGDSQAAAFTFTALDVENWLGLGELVLQANNNIRVEASINSLSMNLLKFDAGKDFTLVNPATITTAGNIEIIGNSANSTHVTAQRGPGPGNIILEGLTNVTTTGPMSTIKLDLQDGSTSGIIDIQPNATVDSNGGDIFITTAPTGAIQFGTFINSEVRSNGGNITLTSNSFGLSGSGTNAHLNTSDLVGTAAGDVTLRPASPVVTMGIEDGASFVQLTQAQLNSNISVSDGVDDTPGTIFIGGDAAPGPTAGIVTVGATGFASSPGRNISLVSNGDVNVLGDLTVNDNLTIQADADADSTNTLDLIGAVSATTGTVELIGGTDGNDILQGPNQPNPWNITGPILGPVQGTLNGDNFRNFGTLKGNIDVDTFVVSIDNGAPILDGGLGSDTVNYSALTGPVSVTLAPGTVDGYDGTELLVGAFKNINDLVGSSDFTDELTGPNVDNIWNITASDAGDINASTLTYSGFESLFGGPEPFTNSFEFADGITVFRVVGNPSPNLNTVDMSAWTASTDFEVTGTDTFVVNRSLPTEMDVQRVGRIIGGSGLNVLDLSGAGGPVTVDLQADTATFISGGFLNFQDFRGTTGVDELIGPGITSLWTVSALSSGDIDGTLFSSFENLTGGASGDDFNVNDVVGGTIRGGGGPDTFNLNADVGGSVFGDAGSDIININAPQGVAGLDLVFEAEIITNSTANLITADQLTLDAGSLPDTIVTNVDELTVNNVNGAVVISNTIGSTTLVQFSGGSPSDVTITNVGDFVIAPGVNLQASGFVDISTLTGNIDIRSGGSVNSGNGFDLDAGASVLLGTIIDSSAASSFVTAIDSIVNTTGGGTNITTGGFVTLTAPTIGTIADPIEIDGPFILVDAGTEFGVKHIGDFFMSGFVLDGAGPGLFEVMGLLTLGGGNDFGANQIVRADTMNILSPITASGPLTLEGNQLNVLNDIDASGSTLTLEASNELSIISDAEVAPVDVNATDLIIDAPIISVEADGNPVKIAASNSILINGGSLTVQGGDGFGDFASIDPVSLVLNLSGPLSVIAGAGDFATADLVADSISITATQVTVQGGSGLSAQAHITALSGFLNLVADDVLITGGLGVSADAYIGALFEPLTITATTCFDCTELAGEPPFDDGITEQGVFGSPVTINLPPLPLPLPLPPPPGGGTPSEPPLVGEQLLQEVATRGTLQGLDGFPFPPSPFSPGQYPEKAPADDGPGMCT